MFIKILAVLAVVVIAFLIMAALQPTEMSISRSAVVRAAPSVVFSHVNTTRSWEAWSPWVRLDPEMKTTYSGPPAGVGAITAWVGRKSGEGRTTIVASREGELVRFELVMIKPMAATNTVDFSFHPQAGGTRVTWTMHCHRNFLAKAFGLIVDCDKMVGAEFEHGLANLAEVTESAAPAA